MNEELLRGCFLRLRKDAAAGIDQVTKQEYKRELEANLSNLVNRLHRMSYIPQPVRRVYIPKPGSRKQRPLGIPALEDKLVQAGMVKILEAIYEQDFIEDSYGFRPGRGCHDALRSLSQAVDGGRTHYIVEADIRSFFDTVDQEQLMKFLGHRIADKRILRYVKRFLKAGIMEDGIFVRSEEGTPQGGVISPLLANIYLHYTMDLWFTLRFLKGCQGYGRYIRYADDYVACFQLESDAVRFRQEMELRLQQFGLGIAPEKTKILEFGPFAKIKAKRRGEKAESFDFLGFTHYCGRSRNGKRFRMKRQTQRKKFTVKLKVVKEWLKRKRTEPTPGILKSLGRKLQGHYAYYGVTDNSKGINRFGYECQKLLFKWLNRRGGKVKMNWEKFKKLLSRYPLPVPRIRVCLFK